MTSSLSPFRIVELLFMSALLASIAHAQKPGEIVSTDALKKLEWLQGGSPDEWEPDCLYVLDCWATWCPNCIGAMPELERLHAKYAARGLRVIGVDVWEDGRDKVAEFVKNNPAKMSYPVGYTGKGGEFEKSWLVPTGVKGIPHYFLVKNGKVIAGLHPILLTEKLVESLLQRGEAGDLAAAEFIRDQDLEAKRKVIEIAYNVANNARRDGEAGKVAAMEAARKNLLEIDPDNERLAGMQLEIDFAREDWDAVRRTMDVQRVAGLNRYATGSFVNSVDESTKAPQDLIVRAVAVMEGNLTEEDSKMPPALVNLSRLTWRAGDQAKALELARAALKAAEVPRLEPLYKASCLAFLKALEEGRVMNGREVYAVIRGGPPSSADSSQPKATATGK